MAYPNIYEKAFDDMVNACNEVVVALKDYQNYLKTLLPEDAKILVDTLAKSGPSWTAAAKVLSYTKGMPDEWRFPAEVRYAAVLKNIFDQADLLVCGDPAETAAFADQLFASALPLYSPSQCMFYFIDVGSGMFAKYRQLPHTIAYLDSIGFVPELLDRVNRYIRQNRQDRPSLRSNDVRLRHLYLVISGLESLLSSPRGSKIRNNLRSILQNGIDANVHVIAFAGGSSGTEIPFDLRKRFSYRAALYGASAHTIKKLIGKPDEALLIPGELHYRDAKHILKKIGNYHQAISEEEIESRIRFWVGQRTDAPEDH